MFNLFRFKCLCVSHLHRYCLLVVLLFPCLTPAQTNRVPLKTVFGDPETYWAETFEFELSLDKAFSGKQSVLDGKTYLSFRSAERGSVYALVDLDPALRRFGKGEAILCRGTLLHTGRTFLGRRKTYALLVRDIINPKQALLDAPSDQSALEQFREQVVKRLVSDAKTADLSVDEYLTQRPDQARRSILELLSDRDQDSEAVKDLFSNWIFEDLRSIAGPSAGSTEKSGDGGRLHPETKRLLEKLTGSDTP